MTAGDVREPPPYRYGELTPGNFERLVHRLAWLDDSSVIRVKAPDGGMDIVAPDPVRHGKAARGWQAKRHTGSIDWRDCRSSWDSAVARWGPRSITFVFPRDLTAGEDKSFHDTFDQRTPGVVADYWNASTLDARLGTVEGQRVAAHFFETEDARVLAERLLRAGGPLETGEDVVAVETAIDDAVGKADLDFDWIRVAQPPDAKPPALSDGAMLRLTIRSETNVLYLDAVPRGSIDHRDTRMVIKPDDTEQGQKAREWLADLASGGGRLTLTQGVGVLFEDLPKPFGDLLADTVGGTVLLRANREAVAYYGSLCAGPDHRRYCVDIDLLPTQPPDDWDAMLEGRLGGLRATILFRWFVEQGRGEARLRFAYEPSNGPHQVEAMALRWMQASMHGGSVTIRDRFGVRPPIGGEVPAQRIPEWLSLWTQLHEDLAVLEGAAGQPAPPVPETLTGGQVHAVHVVAQMLRERMSSKDVREFTMRFHPGAKAFPKQHIFNDVCTEHTLVANVFGQQMPVARQSVRLPPMVASRSSVGPDGGLEITCVPLGGESVETLFRLTPLAEFGDLQEG